MSLKWNFLDWKLPVKYMKDRHSVQILNIDNQQNPHSIVLQNKATTSIVSLNSTDWDLKQPVSLLENIAEGKDIFQTGGTVYMIDYEGNLYHLLCTANSSTGSGNSVFGLKSSGSSDASETFSWSKSGFSLGNVVCVTGVNGGFAVIEDSSGVFYLKSYEFKGRPVLLTSHRLPPADNSNWTIKSCLLGPKFLFHLFGALSMVMYDMLVISAPTGFISLYPILAQSSENNLKPIHCDVGELISIDQSPCKNALIFFYNNGKVIFAIFDENSKEIIYKKHYFSTNVEAAVVVGENLNFSLVFSNGFNLFYTKLTNLNDFEFNEIETKLTGIFSLFKVKQDILAWNINSCFYKVTFVLENLNEFSMEVDHIVNCNLSHVDKIGAETENIKKEIRKCDEKLNAILNEQLDSSQFVVNLDGSQLIIKNCSDRIFKKEHWSVFVESNIGKTKFSETFLLKSDLDPNSAEIVCIDEFISNGISNSQVFLISNVGKNERILFFSLRDIKITQDKSLSKEQDIVENVNYILSL